MRYDLNNEMDFKRAQVHFKSLLNKKGVIVLKDVRKKRTIRQNAYLHVCVTLYAINFGYRIEEAKTLLKRGCPFMRYHKNKEWFLRSTSDLDTKEMTDFIEWIRNHAVENGLYIPSPEEYLEYQENIEREIEQHKKYL